MRIGIPTKKIHKITLIDYWFLHQIEEMVMLEKQIENYKKKHGADSIPPMPTYL